MSHNRSKTLRYRHFLLHLWQEGDREMRWRISLYDPQTEVRIGFKTVEELVVYLDRWMTGEPIGQADSRQVRAKAAKND